MVERLHRNSIQPSHTLQKRKTLFSKKRDHICWSFQWPKQSFLHYYSRPSRGPQAPAGMSHASSEQLICEDQLIGVHFSSSVPVTKTYPDSSLLPLSWVRKFAQRNSLSYWSFFCQLCSLQCCDTLWDRTGKKQTNKRTKSHLYSKL